MISGEVGKTPKKSLAVASVLTVPIGRQISQVQSSSFFTLGVTSFLMAMKLYCSKSWLTSTGLLNSTNTIIPEICVEYRPHDHL